MDAPERSSVGTWALPALGVITLLFTFFTGVPWLSKAEFAFYILARDAQWTEQHAINARVERGLDRLEAAHGALEARVRALEQTRGRP